MTNHSPRSIKKLLSSAAVSDCSLVHSGTASTKDSSKVTNTAKIPFDMSCQAPLSANSCLFKDAPHIVDIL